MKRELRASVRQRADDRCEYCQIHQRAAAAVPFHVEHVVAKQHGGPTDAANLAFACDRCNGYKGTNLSAIDPLTGAVVLLFHPRADRWSDHFAMQSGKVVGLTATGRATATLLQMNALHRVQLRQISDLADQAEQVIMHDQYSAPK